MPDSSNSKFGTVAEGYNLGGSAEFVLICEHASNRIPDELDGLGLGQAARQSHIAWDPGALDVALQLSEMLDAPLIAGGVSRLVYDCNRPPESPGAMPARSEIYEIPGNQNLTDADRTARVQEVYEPFCDSVSKLLDARVTAGQTTRVITIHSFTPVFFGKARAVEIGILHDQDRRFADALLGIARDLHPEYAFERNQPYGPEDGVTHSLRVHAQARDLLSAMIEIRNDLLADSAGCRRVAGVLGAILSHASDKIPVAEARNA